MGKPKNAEDECKNNKPDAEDMDPQSSGNKKKQGSNKSVFGGASLIFGIGKNPALAAAGGLYNPKGKPGIQENLSDMKTDKPGINLNPENRGGKPGIKIFKNKN